MIRTVRIHSDRPYRRCMSEKSGTPLAPDGDSSAEELRLSWLGEDWASVVVGLALIALVFVGAIPGWLVP